MDYYNYAEFSNTPPYYNKPSEEFSAKSQGIPLADKFHMTQADIYKSGFLLSRENPVPQDIYINVAEKELDMNNEVARIFFSDRNMRRIQQKIKQAVYDKTHGKFKMDADQDNKDLLIVMTAVYKLNAKFLRDYPVRQVKTLNSKTVDFLIPDLITNIKQYYGYLKDINTPMQMITRPLNTSNAGRRTLPSLTTTFGLY